MFAPPRPGIVAGLAALAACTPAEPPEPAPFAPVYRGVETRLLDGDLVAFAVAMDGARGNEDVAAYARCAAAQYTLIRGFGFARHVRTNVARSGNHWQGDAVYVISAALPPGLRTIDAEVTVADCVAQGIPTV
ncbi:MAG: hypothetical protein KJZ85_06975 [Rhodobacteraceae bacterium]|jgi:hypothetical protein|nr:hypothetical protein [Paracoccaceae bacterium]